VADFTREDPKKLLDPFGQIFQDLFASGPLTKDISLGITIPLVRAAHGGKHELDIAPSTRCPRCGGTGGRPGATLGACSTCRGTGLRGGASFEGALGPCTECEGRKQRWDQPCEACRGRGKSSEAQHLVVTIPPGVEEGHVLRLVGKGNDLGDGPGDLLLTLLVTVHPSLTRKGADLHAKARLTEAVASNGGTVEVPWLEGTARVKVAAGARVGDEVRLPGWGAVRFGAPYAPPPDASESIYRASASPRGDLIVTLVDPDEATTAYEVLGVREGASQGEVEAAYRRLSVRVHAAMQRGAPGAEERLAEITRAFESIPRTEPALRATSSHVAPSEAPSDTRAVAIVSAILGAVGLVAWLLMR
jgi:DnaJ-class molecular chaperone